MPKITVPKDSLKGLPPIPPGIYEFRLDGFEPKLSKQKPGKDQSVNLNPILNIINHATLNGRRLPENLNVQAGWVMQDLVHALGVPMADEGTDDAALPGEFQPPNEPDPTKWQYIGPLAGKVGKAEVALVPNQRGGMRSAIKRYFCVIPGCSERHSEDLT